MANVFVGERVRLRDYEPPDEALFRYWDQHNPDGGRLLWEIRYPVSQTILDEPAPKDAPSPAPGDNFPFSIEALDGGVLVGAIHVQRCDLRNGTFSYGISLFPPYQGKGYGSEAVRLVLRHYFRERGYQKCTVEAYSFNTASIRLHERLGFTLEARLRRMTYTQGAFHDALSYGITKEEFEATQNNVETPPFAEDEENLHDPEEGFRIGWEQTMRGEVISLEEFRRRMEEDD